MSKNTGAGFMTNDRRMIASLGKGRLSRATVFVLVLIFLAYFYTVTTLDEHEASQIPVNGSEVDDATLNGTFNSIIDESDHFDPIPNWTGQADLAKSFPSSRKQYELGTGHIKSEKGRGPPRFRPVHNLKPKSHEPKLVTCKGPRGKALDRSREDRILFYAEQSPNYQDPPLGSSRVAGFEQDVCYERHGRHAAYGLGQTDDPPIVWDEVDWWELQTECVKNNKHRYDLSPRDGLKSNQKASQKSKQGDLIRVPRTAVVFRLHQYTKYTEEAKRNMRAIIQEVALYSGGQYQVFLLVEIKDPNLNIWDSPDSYDKAIQDIVPPEFWGMTVLWTESDWYEKYDMIDIPFLNVHLGQWYSMQFFREIYPEFDFYWNWEMDVRYTGHYFDLVRAADKFAAAQPRKGLWERNARIYIPSVHGTYKQFRDKVQERYIINGDDTSIWGPYFPLFEPSDEQIERVIQLDTLPPVEEASKDNFKWGIGEDADLITFLPLFEPQTTNYIYKDAFRNYEPTLKGEDLPRRATIITFTRLSSRLLQLMEAETSKAPMHHMGSEMWPHSLSLHYGLKAVYVPHGIHMSEKWPTQALDFVFNNGDHSTTLAANPQLDPRGEGAGGPASTFGFFREHHWKGTTWYYRNDLAHNLYARWLGWERGGIGGKRWEDAHGKYCLPPMLLHPIKEMYDPPDAQ